jgi:hypothetical protein
MNGSKFARQIRLRLAPAFTLSLARYGPVWSVNDHTKNAGGTPTLSDCWPPCTIFFVFANSVGPNKAAVNAMIASASAGPESRQIVGKWFFQRGSVTQKKWKSPHKHWRFVVGLGGLEPPTSPLSVLRSLVPCEGFGHVQQTAAYIFVETSCP